MGSIKAYDFPFNCKHGLPVIKLQTDRCLDHIELKINLQL